MAEDSDFLDSIKQLVDNLGEERSEIAEAFATGIVDIGKISLKDLDDISKDINLKNVIGQLLGRPFTTEDIQLYQQDIQNAS